MKTIGLTVLSAAALLSLSGCTVVESDVPATRTTTTTTETSRVRAPVTGVSETTTVRSY